MLGSSIPGILQAEILEWVAFPSPGDLPDPEFEPGSPALPTDHQQTSSMGGNTNQLQNCQSPERLQI